MATEHPLDGAIESQRELYSGAVSTEDKAEDLASLLVLLAESGRCQEVMDEYSKYGAKFATVSSLADAKAFNSAAKAFADQGDFEQALKLCNAALTAAEALPLPNPLRWLQLHTILFNKLKALWKTTNALPRSKEGLETVLTEMEMNHARLLAAVQQSDSIAASRRQRYLEMADSQKTCIALERHQLEIERATCPFKRMRPSLSQAELIVSGQQPSRTDVDRLGQEITGRLHRDLRAKRIRALAMGASSVADFLTFTSSLTWQAEIAKLAGSHFVPPFTLAAELAKEAWYHLRVASAGPPGDVDGRALLHAVEERALKALHVLRSTAGGEGSSSDSAVHRMEVAQLAYKSLQEAAARWRQDWPAALLWADQAQGSVLVRQLRKQQGAEPAGSPEISLIQAPDSDETHAYVKRLAAALPSTSIAVVFSALHVSTLTAPTWQEVPQPAVEPGILSLLLHPDGRVCGTLQPDPTADFRSWAFKDKGLHKSDPVPTLAEAIKRAVTPVEDGALRSTYGLLGVQQAAMQELHKLLLQPLAGLLPDNLDHIVFVPDKVLGAVPMAALWDGSSYIIERCGVSMASSMSAFVEQKHHAAAMTSRPQRPWLVVSHDIQSSIPGVFATGSLAKRIGAVNVLPPDSTLKAVEDALPCAGGIVIVCHGTVGVESTRDTDGELCLANEQRLTVGTLEQLDLQAALALLYVCHSGGGRSTAEGILGMSRALQLSGVPCVIGSAWKAWVLESQKHALVLAEQLASGSTLAAAARHAALHLIQQGCTPHYWAVFVCHGYPFFALAHQDS